MRSHSLNWPFLVGTPNRLGRKCVVLNVWCIIIVNMYILYPHASIIILWFILQALHMYYHAINFRWSRPDMAYWLAKLCAATWSNSCVHNTTHKDHASYIGHITTYEVWQILHAFDTPTCTPSTNTLTIGTCIYSTIHKCVCIDTEYTFEFGANIMHCYCIIISTV